MPLPSQWVSFPSLPWGFPWGPRWAWSDSHLLWAMGKESDKAVNGRRVAPLSFGKGAGREHGEDWRISPAPVSAFTDLPLPYWASHLFGSEGLQRLWEEGAGAAGPPGDQLLAGALTIRASLL